MIIKGLFELVYSLLNIVLTPFQLIPDMPAGLVSLLDSFVAFITAPIQLAMFFFPSGYLQIAIPVLIVVINMEHIWDGIIWILKKLPFVGIE